ncbi:hypothetical protein AC481_04160 [miscellaneous Crenarchaeota group archaeon SMTZ-80]|nr:MAG: hypothetical protein AC481_04160 [miscellaneous Crenarchaeota group archaeon SMTZ-80]
MAILITGGTGFLGWYLAKALSKKGEDVIAFDVASLKKHQRISNFDNIKVIKGDLASLPEIINIISRYDVEHIFHNGALLSETAEKRHVAAFRVNVEGTFNLLESARIFDIKKFIFTSTLATYGRDFEDIILYETPQRPESMYGVSKVFGERLGEYYSSRFKMDFRAVRFPSVIGAGRGGGGLSAYTSLIIQEPALGRAYEVFVSKDARTPFIYVKDAVRCLMLLFYSDKNKIRSKTYIISGMSPRADEIVEMIKKYIPDAKIEFVPDPNKDKIVHTWPSKLDEIKAKNEWGWQAEYGLKDTIQDFIKEVQAHKELYE